MSDKHNKPSPSRRSDRPDACWEVGSDFHWMGAPVGACRAWPQPNRWFGLGRDTVWALWNMLSVPDELPNLWVPDYFCPEVLEYWITAGLRVQSYEDNPLRREPVWNSINARPGDFVMAVNYFAMRGGDCWKEWKGGHQEICLIEDHTHDPLSAWAMTSSADYAFASLRKTCPAPDGGILWSPTSKPLPAEPKKEDWRGSSLKLASMILKRDYLHGGGETLKPAFRKLQLESEQEYSLPQQNSLPPWSRILYQAGISEVWRKQRAKNVSHLLSLVSSSKLFEVLFTEWPEGACPFNVVLILDDLESRDALRQRLASSQIFAPVHWGSELMQYPESVSLSEKIITIPVDQRYSDSDLKRIGVVLNQPSRGDS